MNTFLVRSYWYKETNPDEVTITKANVQAKDVSEAYDLGYPTPEQAPAGYQLLNWVIIP
jgi:hypothetical protein